MRVVFRSYFRKDEIGIEVVIIKNEFYRNWNKSAFLFQGRLLSSLLLTMNTLYH